MNVLFVVAEMAPLAKVGGVGDVGGSLPRALRRLGLDVRVALPYYESIRRLAGSPLSLTEGEGPGVRESDFAPQRIAALPDGAALWRAEVRGVPVYLFEHEPSFGRDQVYGYPDDADRFLAFSDGLLAAAERLHAEPGERVHAEPVERVHAEPVERVHAEPVEAWQPDAIHLHDWHTAFLAARLAGGSEHPWAGVPRVFTIHNLGYAGAYKAAWARSRGLPLAGPAAVRSALGQGILHADRVTTVSPTYAREILAPELGGKLAPLLRQLGDRLSGILNGIDTEQFDPARDPHLATTFDASSIERRAANKRALQERLGLPVDDAVPLVAMVNRLFVQKGSDLAVEAVEALLSRRGFQFAALGTGDKIYEQQLLALAERAPQRVAVRIAFDPPLGQLFYGGCDLFLMPSRYEPCGLGQLIAMRYGAIPVVRRTGGLADSVPPYDPQRNAGAGFLFDEATAGALAEALERALVTYEDPPSWRALQARAMAQDVSWDGAAQQYAELYRRAAEQAR
jgi:starch synthase